MIRPKVKSFEITEVPDLETTQFVPEDSERFCCTVGLKMGPSEGEGEELFYLTVCAPRWLATACEKDGFIWDRHHLIVPEYNLQEIIGIITKVVERCTGESWRDVGEKLSRFASWEFEDYREAS